MHFRWYSVLLGGRRLYMCIGRACNGLYLHSALTQRRIPTRTVREKQRLLRFNTVDVVIAMVIAGLVNMAMLYMAASTFHFRGLTHAYPPALDN